MNFLANSSAYCEIEDKNISIYFGYGHTSFGEVLLAYADEGICYLSFIDDNKDFIYKQFQKLFQKASLIYDDKKANEYLENIFINNKKYNLVLKGTNFQVDVWKALLDIPYGTVVTYQYIANFINRPKSVRAVANAIGRNHIAYLIPCHRVALKSGAIGGYRWGIARKRLMLLGESIKN